MAWVHRLRNINETYRTAICLKCGPVRIRKKGITKKDGTFVWRCCTSVGKYDSNIWSKARKYRNSKSKKCARCGFVPEDVCQLDVHHIDFNHDNNKRENLLTLCANCHRMFLLKRIRTGDNYIII